MSDLAALRHEWEPASAFGLPGWRCRRCPRTSVENPPDDLCEPKVIAALAAEKARADGAHNAAVWEAVRRI